jgi:hypothetical protein
MEEQLSVSLPQKDTSNPCSSWSQMVPTFVIVMLVATMPSTMPFVKADKSQLTTSKV